MIISAKTFIDAKRRLRKVNASEPEIHNQFKDNKYTQQPRHDSIHNTIIQQLDNYISLYDQTRDHLIRCEITHHQFKDSHKGDFYIELFRNEEDIKIEYWINMKDDLYRQYIANIFKIGQRNKKSIDKLRAIAVVSYGEYESFVDVYTDYIQSVIEIKPRLIDYTQFKQLYKDHNKTQ